ncbi:uncharacterized protein LOC129602855 [Paramacrobiotus metropolitanus]|uniref:uncharacterized protein LOC129602855 n=1 Tax=Paramacrobiotus metropolitanus TaxID=2943436 RepID=UPI002445DE1F|nr:uncharacterized protein LOC129602855 [Paramacrobiotus metropolitanus]
MAVNHLQRQRDLISESEQSSATDARPSEQDHPVARRSRRSTQNEAVVLSSKFVVGRIRSRHESLDDNNSEAYWCEFPKSNAESLEKRGIEVIPQSQNVSLPRKDRVAIPEIYGVKAKQKRDAKGKLLKNNRSLSGGREKILDYYLTSQDLEWITLYNRIAQTKKMKPIPVEMFEVMINMLERRKNEIILKRMKMVLTVICKTAEGTPRRFEREYQALQRFIELTPEVLAVVNHNAMGTVAGLSGNQSFDVWEYWKCKLQDDFYQPLIAPSAPDFDYRRISLIAAWNMTSVSYAKGIRHDAERIRLMYDLLQKRNFVLAKSFTKEEDVDVEFSELLLSSDARYLSPSDLADMNSYIQDFCELSKNEEEDESRSEFLSSVYQWIKLGIEELPESKEIDPASISPRRQSFTSRSEEEKPPVLHTAPLPEPLPEPALAEKKADELRRKGKPSDRKMLLSTRATRARVEPVRHFEHGDNSCCENGPMDEDEELLHKPLIFDQLMAGLKNDSDLDTEETLYMLNNFSLDDAGIVLQEFNTPSKSSDLRSRLRSRKPRVS